MKRALMRSALIGLVGLTACVTGSPPAPTPPRAVTPPERVQPTPETAPANDAALDYQALDARAEREIKRAAQSGFLWLNTESYLAAAREADKAGKRDEAVRLTREALAEALLAQKQAAESAATKADYRYHR